MTRDDTPPAVRRQPPIAKPFELRLHLGAAGWVATTTEHPQQPLSDADLARLGLAIRRAADELGIAIASSPLVQSPAVGSR